MRWCICVVLTTVVGGGGAARTDDADAVKFINGLGGKIKRDDNRWSQPVIEVALRGTTVTDAGLKELKEALPRCFIIR
jgi:hypothetical protein